MKLTTPPINRRHFFRKAFTALLSLQLAYFFFRFLLPSKQATKLEDMYEAGELSYFEKGQVYPFGSAHFYLYRTADGGFLALSSKCTHLGCTVQFNTEKNKYECPCHASAFNANGEVLSAPAIRALDYFPVQIHDNKVLVDIHHPIKRNKYEPSQVAYNS